MLTQKLLLKNKKSSTLTEIISPSGRRLYRHSSGMGTVMCFNDGRDREVLVLDAAYRTTAIMCANYTDTLLRNYTTLNTSGNWDIDGDGDFDADTNHPQMTDEELNSLWVDSIDSGTSKSNTDVWLTQTNPEAANYCRSIKVDGVGCDIPNIQTLMRIFCEANLLDSMDPTVSTHPANALGDANSNGWWRIAGSILCWSSTEYYSNDCRLVYCGGSCGYNSKDSSRAVVPVLQISNNDVVVTLSGKIRSYDNILGDTFELRNSANDVVYSFTVNTLNGELFPTETIVLDADDTYTLIRTSSGVVVDMVRGYIWIESTEMPCDYPFTICNYTSKQSINARIEIEILGPSEGGSN